MRNHAKSLHLQTSGKKDALLLRLSDYYDIARPATDNVEATAADSSAQGQEEEAEDGENRGDDFEGVEEGEATAGDGGIETNPPDQIVVDAEMNITARSAADEGAIAELLSNREDWLKDYWDYHYSAAISAFKKRRQVQGAN